MRRILIYETNGETRKNRYTLMIVMEETCIVCEKFILSKEFTLKTRI